MGIDISFTTTLTAGQLDQAAGPGASEAVTTTDRYRPNHLDTAAALDATARAAIRTRWTDSYPLDIYASRAGEKFRVAFSTHVANGSDRSDQTLAAKIDVLIEAVRSALGDPNLPVLETDC